LGSLDSQTTWFLEVLLLFTHLEKDGSNTMSISLHQIDAHSAYKNRTSNLWSRKQPVGSPSYTRASIRVPIVERPESSLGGVYSADRVHGSEKGGRRLYLAGNGRLEEI
jgi:hypothetical protein